MNRNDFEFTQTDAFLRRVYGNMKFRCLDKRADSYENYGGKGITICDRWLESFENFKEDMKYPPERRPCFDRRDNSKGYTPENCRWVSKTLQALNRNFGEDQGVSKNGNKWEAYLYLDNEKLYFGLYDTKEEAKKARSIADRVLDKLEEMEFLV